MDYPCPEEIKKMFHTVTDKGVDYFPIAACDEYFKWLKGIHGDMRPGDRIEVRGNDNDPDGWYWWNYTPSIQ